MFMLQTRQDSYTNIKIISRFNEAFQYHKYLKSFHKFPTYKISSIEPSKFIYESIPFVILFSFWSFKWN